MEGAVDFRSRQDAIRQGKILSFFLLKRQEEDEGERGGGEVRSSFKCIINSLSALVWSVLVVRL